MNARLKKYAPRWTPRRSQFLVGRFAFAVVVIYAVSGLYSPTLNDESEPEVAYVSQPFMQLSLWMGSELVIWPRAAADTSNLVCNRWTPSSTQS